MKRLLTIHTAILVVTLILAVARVDAGTVLVPGMSGGALIVSNVTSLKEARYRSTIHQKYDFSCGSAALATLLTHHYEDRVSEQEVFTWMYTHGEQEKIRREGFSLLDMKYFLEAHGYLADGYRVELDKLALAGVPAIVLVNMKGYRHFVVVKGVTDKRVLVGDPGLGTRIVARNEFEKMWNGLVFIIRNRSVRSENNFNRLEEWRRVREKAPLGLALKNSDLASITMLLPGSGGVLP